MIPLRRKYWIPIMALALVAGLYLAGHRALHKSLQLELAPDFSLPDLTGRPVTLSSYRGKVVLLDFWATWCEPCRDEIPGFVQLQNEYGSHGLQIIGISMDDTVTPVRDFYQRFHINYPVIMGGAKMGELYGGVLGLPIAFVIGKDGRILAKHIGAISMEVVEKEIRASL